MIISIHALVKRATKSASIALQTVGISIHALVKRATMRFISADKNSFYFNPRPREEGDKSSHTSLCDGGNFNPRPREEGDKILCVV